MHDFLFQEKHASDADLDAPNKLESDAKLASKIHIFAGGRGGARRGRRLTKYVGTRFVTRG